MRRHLAQYFSVSLPFGTLNSPPSEGFGDSISPVFFLVWLWQIVCPESKDLSSAKNERSSVKALVGQENEPRERGATLGLLLQTCRRWCAPRVLSAPNFITSSTFMKVQFLVGSTARRSTERSSIGTKLGSYPKYHHRHFEILFLVFARLLQWLTYYQTIDVLSERKRSGAFKFPWYTVCFIPDITTKVQFGFLFILSEPSVLSCTAGITLSARKKVGCFCFFFIPWV